MLKRVRVVLLIAAIVAPATVTAEQASAKNAACGNGIVESGEQCDRANLNGQTCGSMGFTVGTLSCNSDCTFNASACKSVLFTPALRAGTHEALSCTAINIGATTLDVRVDLVEYPPSTGGLGSALCPTLASAQTATFGQVCSRGYAGPVEVYCRITVANGPRDSVRAVMSIWDSNGGAMNTVDAK
jgi:hypothetical protein